MSKDELGDRMKGFYEARASTQMFRRIPIIVRVDGRSFSKFCKRFKKPYDPELHEYLNETMLAMCNDIQGVKFAERHSDEISFLITDYDKLTTDAFFDYGVQKVCSVTAAMATSHFTRSILSNNLGQEVLKVEDKWPQFDSRCFNIPESDVVNYFYWRILDARRNSISMHAQDKYSHRKLQGVSNKVKKLMLSDDHGINWDEFPDEVKTGYICVKREMEKEIPGGPYKGQTVTRKSWCVEPTPWKHLDLTFMIDKALYIEENKENKEAEEA